MGFDRRQLESGKNRPVGDPVIVGSVLSMMEGTVVGVGRKLKRDWNAASTMEGNSEDGWFCEGIGILRPDGPMEGMGGPEGVGREVWVEAGASRRCGGPGPGDTVEGIRMEEGGEDAGSTMDIEKDMESSRVARRAFSTSSKL